MYVFTLGSANNLVAPIYISNNDSMGNLVKNYPHSTNSYSTTGRGCSNWSNRMFWRISTYIWRNNNMEEQPTINNEQEQNNESYDVIGEINRIKESMVDKEAYDKLRAERDKYAKALVEGTKVNDDQPKHSASVEDLRNKLFNSELSNLEYVEAALELREAILQDTNGANDIFVGKGSKLTPSEEDYKCAEKVAEAFKSCVEVADGNSEIFTRELMRITNDVKLPRTSGRRR